MVIKQFDGAAHLGVLQLSLRVTACAKTTSRRGGVRSGSHVTGTRLMVLRHTKISAH